MNFPPELRSNMTRSLLLEAGAFRRKVSRGGVFRGRLRFFDRFLVGVGFFPAEVLKAFVF